MHSIYTWHTHLTLSCSANSSFAAPTWRLTTTVSYGKCNSQINECYFQVKELIRCFNSSSINFSAGAKESALGVTSKYKAPRTK